MKKILFSFLYCVIYTCLSAGNIKPDTVKTGIYITSIHNIDFKQNEYTVNFWLWLTYTNRAFDFTQNLEIPKAKSFSKSLSTIDSSSAIFTCS